MNNMAHTLTKYAKVKLPGKKSIYLEDPKFIKDGAFICGYQIMSRCAGCSVSGRKSFSTTRSGWRQS
jgi:hypothetical protein